jgi:hypothetical protein
LRGIEAIADEDIAALIGVHEGDFVSDVDRDFMDKPRYHQASCS